MKKQSGKVQILNPKKKKPQDLTTRNAKHYNKEIASLKLAVKKLTARVIRLENKPNLNFD